MSTQYKLIAMEEEESLIEKMPTKYWTVGQSFRMIIDVRGSSLL